MLKKLLVMLVSMVILTLMSLMCVADDGSDIDWPKRTVNIIVPYSAGGDSDFNARTMAQYLGKEWGCSVVVSNVTGAGGSIAATQVKNAAPDGYTILNNHTSMLFNTASGIIDWSYKDAFDIGCIYAYGQPEAIIVRGNAPWNSIDELIKDSQAKPNKIFVAASVGAATQWAPIALNNAGAKLNFVDLGTAGDRVPALLGGHVDVIVNSLSTVKDYLKTGDFKCLALCSTTRSSLYPDIPTLQEFGIDCAYNMSYTFFFPKGTDKRIIRKLETTVRHIVDTNEEYANAIRTAYDQEPVMDGPEKSEEYYSQMLDKLMAISDIIRGEKK